MTSSIQQPFDDEKWKIRRTRKFYGLFLFVRWAENFSNFWDISIHFKDMRNFRFPVFLTVRAYLKTYLNENYSAYRTFYAEFRTVGIFKISLTVQKSIMKAFNFFNSAWPQCEAFLADFRLLYVQNVAEWALMKINQSCFLRQKAEMRSFAAKFILDI